ncbi:MAG: polyphenol oxidase family protein [Actinobacteria bacterium]|nr:polyphenol oxidase family protein [Actinomycetota bacterium]
MRQDLPQVHYGASAATHKAAGGAVYVAPDPEPEGARIWFFTRHGGVSKKPYDSLNVSKKVGDDDAAVEKNRSLIREAMDGRPSAWSQQVHADGVVRVSEAGFAGEADSLVTEVTSFSLVVAVADCVPVALAGGHGIGMVHCGWRGTLSGVAGKAVREMGEEPVRAYVGPCIRGCCYEVSEELAGEFARRFGTGVVSGRYLSLPAAIRADLERAGVEEIHDLGLCTGCRPDLFYSHRKQGPLTGRNLAAVARAVR